MATDMQSMPFIKHLASSDRKIRTTALESLSKFLSASASTARLTHVDNLKLWKGLHYSLWMCDRPIPQQNLCAEIAGLVDVIAASGRRADLAAAAAAGHNDNNEQEGGESIEVAVVIGWLAAFWETIAREWTSIDVLRLEKFLLLVRRMFGASLAWAVAGDNNNNQKKQGRTSKKASSSLSSSSSSSKKAGTAAKSTTSNGKKRKSTTKSTAQDAEEVNNEEDDTESQSASSTQSTKRQAALIDLLQRYPLEEKGDFGAVPVGLRLHVLDIWVDEAEKAGLIPEEKKKTADEDDGEQGQGETGQVDEKSWPYLLTALRQLVDKQQQTTTPSKPIRARAKESLADERLPWNVQGGHDSEEEDAEMGDGGDEEDGWGGFDD